MKAIFTTLLISAAALLNPTISAAQDLVRMREVVEMAVKKGQFAGSVLITQGDKVLFNRGYGLANREWNIANAPTTKFRIGSVTKQFTAAAILLLEERGKLKLTDSIKQYVPDAPAAWDGITIAHLLNHTAGLHNFTDLPAYQKIKIQQLQPADTLKIMRDLPLDFAAGSEFRYSNSGYVLLGQIIETVSGETYAKFLQTNIFKPLGMADSSVDSAAAILPSRASGYKYVQADEKTPPNLANADVINMSIPHAAGAIISTTHDLHRWQKALYGNKGAVKLLSESSLKKMLTPNKGGYALGVQVAEITSKNNTTGADKLVRRIEHGGGIDGFAAWLQYNESNALNVVVLGNIEGGLSGYIAGRLSAMSEGGLPYASLPFYLRGSMNKWDTSARMVLVRRQMWAVDIALEAGSHEFKFGSEDFRQIDFGGSDGQQSLNLASKPVLSIGGNNLKIDIPQSGNYRFNLNARDGYGPKLIVEQLR